MSDLSFVESGVNRLAVVGEIDLASAPQLTKELSQRGPDLELDLNACTFIDSTGIAALVGARSSFLPGLVIVSASAVVQRVLTLCGLAELMIRQPDPASAS